MTGALRVVEHHLMVYRRTWKGGMFVSFASPILFLAAIGIGLGSLIARGPVPSLVALLMIPVVVLNGLAFGAPIFAFTATQRKDKGFPTIGRFIITPLFLLGGVFFPIAQLPPIAQGIAWATPLAHSVVLSRSLAIDGMNPSALIDVAVLAAYATLGIIAASITLPRRLVR